MPKASKAPSPMALQEPVSRALQQEAFLAKIPAETFGKPLFASIASVVRLVQAWLRSYATKTIEDPHIAV